MRSASGLMVDLIDAALSPWVLSRGDRQSQAVALTFDDGPDELTMDYLDMLDWLDVRATFFLVGQACERHPHAAREIVARGHEVAAHGYTHRPFPHLNGRQLQSEFTQLRDMLPPSSYGRLLLRPPRGMISMGSMFQSIRAGYTTVLWSLDSDDCRTTRVVDVVDRVSAAAPGDIVLMHEGQPWTLEALPQCVYALRMRGVRFQTINRWLNRP